jgi:DNA-binding CsgD family transcriptional regulator
MSLDKFPCLVTSICATFARKKLNLNDGRSVATCARGDPHKLFVGRNTVSAVQPRNRLTSREYDVLLALNKGLTNKAITRLLSITENTVKTHVANLFDKLGVSSRLELAVFARHHRIVESNELTALGLSLTNKQKDLLLRAIIGQLCEEDIEPARRLADILAINRQGTKMPRRAVLAERTQ